MKKFVDCNESFYFGFISTWGLSNNQANWTDVLSNFRGILIKYTYNCFMDWIQNPHKDCSEVLNIINKWFEIPIDPLV